MKKNFLLIALFFASIGLNAQYWSQQNTNFSGTSIGVDQVSIVDSNIVWVNGFNGSGTGSRIKAFSKTQDGGNTWTTGTYTGFGATVYPYVLTAASYTTAFAVAMDTASSSASFWQTTDGGTTWTTVASALNGASSFADGVKFWNSTQGFCYGDPVSSEFEIYTTNDGGTTWTAVPGANIPDPSASDEYGYNGFDCAAIVPGGIGVFLTNKGRVFKTIDYGTTWTTTTDPYTTAASGKIYASSANYIILANWATSTSTSYTWKYTTDGGTTWQTFSPSGTFYDYQMCYVPGSPNMFVSTSPYQGTSGVSYSFDGGLNWTDYLDTLLQPMGPNIQCLGVGFYNTGIGWVGNYDQNGLINSILKYHPAPVGMDAGALTILQPSSPTVIGSDVQVIVRVKNFGTTTITSMDIAYQVGTSSPVSVPWIGTLLPDSTLDYTFTTTYVSPDSIYNLCAYTVVTGDIYPSNDETCKSVQGTVGIKEGYIDGLILNQNFPNPTIGFTTIGFTVPDNGEVVLSLMNSIGKVVYRESKKVDVGSHKITLNTSHFTAGVYFYEFKFNGSRLYKKMIIN